MQSSRGTGDAEAAPNGRGKRIPPDNAADTPSSADPVRVTTTTLRTVSRAVDQSRASVTHAARQVTTASMTAVVVVTRMFVDHSIVTAAHAIRALHPMTTASGRVESRSSSNGCEADPTTVMMVKAHKLSE